MYTGSITPHRVEDLTVKETPVVSPRASEAKPHEIYSPPGKSTEVSKATLRLHGIIDEKGIVTERLANMACPKLSDDSCKKIHAIFHQVTDLLNNGFNFNIPFCPALFVDELLKTGEEGILCRDQLIQILFQYAIYVGSGAIAASGVDYVCLLVRLLIEDHFEGREDICAQVIALVITEEFKNYLRHYFDQKLNDIDLRVKVYEDFKDKLKVNLPYILDTYTRILLKMKTKDYTYKEKVKMANLITKRYPKKYANLKPEDPHFDFIAIRCLALNDLCAVNEGKNQFAIANVPMPGHHKTNKGDFVVASDFESEEITPGVQLYVNELLTKEKPDNAIVPQGDNAIQAFVNLITGQVQPSLEIKDGKGVTATANLKMLLKRSIRGEACSIPGGEALVLAGVKEESKDLTNRTIKMIMKREPIAYLDDFFPLYLIELVKEMVKGNYSNDSLAGMALTLNLIRMLENNGYRQINERILSGLKHFCTKDKKKSVLESIFVLVTDTQLPLTETVSFLKLMGYLLSHVKHDEVIDYTTTKVIPISIHSVPFCQMLFPIQAGTTYSVLLENDLPMNYHQDTLNLFRKLRTESHNQTIKEILMGLLPTAVFYGPKSSPLYVQLHHFKKNLTLFESDSKQLLKKNGNNAQLMGLVYLFSTQSQIENTIPLIPLFYVIVNVLIKTPNLNNSLLKNLEVLLKNEEPDLFKTLKEIVDSKINKEDLVIEKWIYCLSKQEKYVAIALDLWELKVINNKLFDAHRVESIIPPLIGNVQRHSLHLAVKTLYDANKLSLLSVETCFNLLKDIVHRIPYDDVKTITCIENLISLNSEDIQSSPHCHPLFVQVVKLYPDFNKNGEIRDILESLQNKNVKPNQVTTIGPLAHKKRTSPLSSRLNRVEMMCQTQPFEASYCWYRVLKKHREISHETALKVTEKICSAIKAKPDETLKFLTHPDIQRVYQKSSEHSTEILLVTLEKLENRFKSTHEQLILSALETLLIQQSQQEGGLPIKRRLFDQVARFTNEGVELPPSFIKAFTDFIPHLLEICGKNDRRFLFRIYNLACALDIPKIFIDNYKVEILNLLQTIVYEELTKDIEKQVIIVIKELSHDLHLGTANEFVRLLQILLKRTQQKEFLVYYFNSFLQISEKNSEEVQNILWQVLDRFMQFDDFFSAKLCLQSLEKVSTLKNPERIKTYKEYVLKLIEGKQGLICCEFLLNNPFDKEIELIGVSELSSLLDTLLKYPKIYAVDLFHILRLARNYTITTDDMWMNICQKLEDIYDEDTMNYLWDILRSDNAFKNLSKNVQEKLWLVAASHLKKRTHQQVLETMNKESSDNKRLYLTYNLIIKKENRGAFYTSILEAWIKGIIKRKHTDLDQQFKVLLAEHKSWCSKIEPYQAFSLTCDILDMMLLLKGKNITLECTKILIETHSSLPVKKEEVSVRMKTDQYKQQVMVRKIIDSIVKNQIEMDSDLLLSFIKIARELQVSDFFLVGFISYFKESNNKEALKICFEIILNILNNHITLDKILVLLTYDFRKIFHHVASEKTHFGLETMMEEIIKHPQLNLIVSNSDEAYLRSSLSYLYFNNSTITENGITKINLKAYDEKIRKALNYYITNIDFIRTCQSAYMTIFGEAYSYVFSCLIEHNEEIEYIHVMKEVFEEDIKKVSYKSEIITYLFKLTSILIIQSYINLKPENDPQQKIRVIRFLNHFKFFIATIGESKHKLSTKELDQIIHFVATLLITNESDLIAKAIEIIKLLHASNFFEEYPWFLYSLKHLLTIRKIDLTSHLSTEAMLSMDSAIKSYLQVIECYSYLIKHYPHLDYLKECIDFFVQHKHIILNREHLQQNDIKVIETWIYDSTSAFTPDLQNKVLSMMGNMLLREAPGIDADMFINLYTTIIFAYVVSGVPSYFKVVYIQMLHSHFLQIALFEPKVREWTNAVNLSTMIVLYMLYERSDFTKSLSGISLLDNPYILLCEFYALCLQNLSMDYIRIGFTQSTLCMSMYSNFQKYGEHHMHLGTIAAYLDFFKKMIVNRSSEPEHNNINEDRKILMDGVNIYNTFYEQLNYNERIKVDVTYNSLMKFLEENTKRIPYFKLLGKEMSVAIQDIQNNTKKLRRPTISRIAPKQLASQLKAGIQVMLKK